MNIKTSFSSSLNSHPRISSGLNPEDFLGHILEIKDEISSPLLNLLSIGKTKAVFPWSFDFKPLSCYLFLYTIRGCGKLTTNNQVFSLSESTLLFLDCHKRFRIDIATEPWEYQIMFINGNALSYYYKLLPDSHLPIIRIHPYSDIVSVLELLTLKSQENNTSRELVISDYLNHLTTCFITEFFRESDAQFYIPSYITKMKILFNENFKDVYTLDSLEELLGINKYRLCREFKQYTGISPMQYLNKKRIDYSAHLLITTTYRIHEIGSMVGIDNTNHFISLFKKYYTITPLEYRQRMSS